MKAIRLKALVLFWALLCLCTFMLYADESQPAKLLFKIKEITPKSPRAARLSRIERNAVFKGHKINPLLKSSPSFKPRKHNKRRKAKAEIKMDRWFSMTVPKGQKVEDVIRQLKTNPDIEAVEKDQIVYTQAVPNDPEFSQLWGMNNIGQFDGYTDKDMDLPEAWESATGDRKVVVAVVDSGIEYNHPDLSQNMWFNQDEIPGNNLDDDGNGYVDDIFGYDFYNQDADPMDDHSHGTHVAGTIGAVGNNGIGVVGVNHRVRLMAVKFIGSFGYGSLTAAVEGIKYAIDNGADVLNNSWGPGESQALQDVLAEAYDQGVVVVAAAGNDNNDRTFYPAAYDHVIAVSAVDRQGKKASFSNFGSFVDVAAPGLDIVSTYIGKIYRSNSGTSMASPHVAGLAALLLSADGTLSPDQIETIITTTCDDLGSPGYDTTFGWGLLNAERALAKVSKQANSLPKAEISLPLMDQPVTGIVSLSGTAIDSDFKKFTVQMSGNGASWSTVKESMSAVLGNVLATIDLRNLEDDFYSMRLIVEDNAGQTRLAQMRVKLNNIDTELSLPPLVTGIIDITGKAAGIPFQRYELAYGAGQNPQTWIQICDVNNPVSNGVLFAGFNTVGLPDGIYTFRLRVHTNLGWQEETLASTTIQNLFLTSPLTNDIVRHGDTLSLKGTVRGITTDFKVEYGVGWNPQSWSQAGVVLAHGGRGEIVDGLLATVNTNTLSKNEFYSFRLTSTMNSTVVNQTSVSMVYLDGQLKAGWPKSITTPTGADAFGLDYQSFVVEDLENDGRKEIVTISYGLKNIDAKLMILNADGTVKFERALNFLYSFSDNNLIVDDIDGDGKKEILIQETQSGNPIPYLIHAFTSVGTPVGMNWPVSLEPDYYAITSADLDGDGKKEIIARGNNSHLYVINFDGSIESHSTLPWSSTQEASVGNIDGTPDLEILAVVGTQIYALKKDGSVLPGWPAPAVGVIPSTVISYPVVGDLNDDGINEIVVVSGKNGVYALDSTGKVLPGWPVLTDMVFGIATPVLADLDGDHQREILIPAFRQYSTFDRTVQQYVFRRDGSIYPGWPKQALGQERYFPQVTSNVVADIDNDHQPDVVLAVGGIAPQAVLSGDNSVNGGILAWKRDGSVIDLNPRVDSAALIMEMGSRKKIYMKPAPVITDLDGNGKLEIIAASTYDSEMPIQDGGEQKMKGRNSLHVWELAAPYNADASPWPHYGRESGITHSWNSSANRNPLFGVVADQTIREGERLEINLSVADLDSDRLAFEVTGLPTQADVLSEPARLSWQSTFFQAGVYSVTITATDFGTPHLSASRTFTLTILESGNPPVVQGIPNQTIEPGQSFSPINLDSFVNDIDNADSELIWSVTGTSELRATVDSANRIATISAPSAVWRGVETLTFEARDPMGGVGTQQVTFWVGNVAPTPANDQATTNEETTIAIDVLPNDSDPNSDTFVLDAISLAPADGTAVINAGVQTISYTPNLNFYGTDHFSYEILDARGGKASAQVTVTVLPVQDRPIANNDMYVTQMNTPIFMNVMENDVDPDGDPIVIIAVSGQLNGTISPVDSLTGSPDFTYTPNVDTYGIENLSYLIKDPGNRRARGLVTLRVNATPRLSPIGEVSANEGEIIGPIDLDSVVDDPDGSDQQMGWAVSNQVNVQATIGLDRKLTIRSIDPRWHGTEDLVLTGSDSYGGIASIPIRVVYRSVNERPVLRNFVNQTILEDAQFEPLALDFYVSDTDHEDDQMVWSVTGGVNLKCVIDAEQVAVITRINPTWTGSETLTFTVRDPEGATNSGTITLTVININENPIPGDDAVAIDEDGEAIVLVLANDSDPDNDSLTLTSVSQPHDGTASIQQANRIVYRPKPNFNGVDIFDYMISDGHGGVARGNISVTVRPVNDAPMVSPIEPKTVREGDRLSFSIGGTDPDGNPLTYVPVDMPQGAVLNSSNGEFSWSPSLVQAGTYEVKLIVHDSAVPPAETPVSIRIVVNEKNRAPVFADIPFPIGTERESLSILVSAVDPDGDKVMLSASQLPSGSQFDAESGFFTWTPAQGQSGDHTIRFRASDGNEVVFTEVMVRVMPMTPVAPAFTTEVFKQFKNFFNPAKGEKMNIEYELAESGSVSLEIYDTQGYTVAQLQSGSMPAGHHTMEWNGHNSDGSAVSSGVYLIRMHLNGNPILEKKKVVVLK